MIDCATSFRCRRDEQAFFATLERVYLGLAAAGAWRDECHHAVR
jgi:hypothetical protein